MLFLSPPRPTPTHHYLIVVGLGGRIVRLLAAPSLRDWFAECRLCRCQTPSGRSRLGRFPVNCVSSSIRKDPLGQDVDRAPLTKCSDLSYCNPFAPSLHRHFLRRPLLNLMISECTLAALAFLPHVSSVLLLLAVLPILFWSSYSSHFFPVLATRRQSL